MSAPWLSISYIHTLLRALVTSLTFSSSCLLCSHCKASSGQRQKSPFSPRLWARMFHCRTVIVSSESASISPDQIHFIFLIFSFGMSQMTGVLSQLCNTVCWQWMCWPAGSSCNQLNRLPESWIMCTFEAFLELLNVYLFSERESYFT